MLKLDIPVTDREFCVDLVQKTGVMLTPGDAFDMQGYARIGFANDEQTLTKGSCRFIGLFKNTVLNRH